MTHSRHHLTLAHIPKGGNNDAMKTSLPGMKAVEWLLEDHADSRRVLARVLNRAPSMQCP